MDGTLVDSTAGVLSAWQTFSRDYKLGEGVASLAHGRRLHDTLREYCGIDGETLEAEVIRFEEEVIHGGPVLLPGVLQLLNQLSLSKWTIVTSATNIYTPRALAACTIPIPHSGYITASSVVKGKPHPDPYIAGAHLCSVNPTNCLVIEDAPSGIAAGLAAGATTLAVCTSHSRQAILASGCNPDYIVRDLTRVSATQIGDHIHIAIDDEAV